MTGFGTERVGFGFKSGIPHKTRNLSLISCFALQHLPHVQGPVLVTVFPTMGRTAPAISLPSTLLFWGESDAHHEQ